MYSEIVEIKTTLKKVKPPVRRTVLLPLDITLHDLHQTIQVAMGWKDCHLYVFEADGLEWSYPDPDWNTGELSSLEYRWEFFVVSAQISG